MSGGSRQYIYGPDDEIESIKKVVKNCEVIKVSVDDAKEMVQQLSKLIEECEK